MKDFLKILNLPDDEFDDIEGDADSLAGLLLEIKVTSLQYMKSLIYKDYKFEVLEIEERRISKVKVIVCGANNE